MVAWSTYDRRQEGAGMARRGRRANGEGSIFRRSSDGRWVTQLTVGYKANGKPDRKTLTGHSAREVAEKLAVAQAELARGVNLKPERLAVADLLDRWLASLGAANLAPKTLTSYEATVRLHLKPALGGLQVGGLSALHVEALLAEKIDAGQSPRSVRYMLVVLRLALGWALRRKLVGVNVALDVAGPKVTRHRVEPMTPDEARRLLAAASGDRLEALYVLALALGFRQGEALGLTWADVDLDVGVVRVRKQLQRLDGKLVRRDLKTEGSRRDLPLYPDVAAALRAHRKRQLAERVAAPRWEDHDLVFCSARGTPLEPSNVRKRYKKILAAAGLPERRYHDLRHSCASFLLALGVSTKGVQEILGHSQSATTLDIYAHLLPGAKEKAVGDVGRLLAGE